MNKRNAGIGAIIFTSGSAIGAAVSWLIARNVYRKRNEEDANEQRELYKKREKDILKKLQKEYGFEISDEKKESEDKPKDKKSDDILAAGSSGQRVDYTKFFSKDPPESVLEETPKPNLPPESVPYVIDPDDFGEDDYEPLTLTYYSDGVLVDEDDEPVENVDEVVGKDALKLFGEYQANAVYARNERLKCDYEILRDSRRFSDILEADPFLKDRLRAMGVVDS